MSYSELTELFKQKLVIADGPMGTMIKRLNLPESDYKSSLLANHPVDLSNNCDILNLTQPDIIKNIHTAYLKAGADLICTNTLNSNQVSQQPFQLENQISDLNQSAVKLARLAAEPFQKIKPCFIAGVIGPTDKSSSVALYKTNKPATSISPDELYDAFYQQAESLLIAGIDLFLIETIFDLNNGLLALQAIADIQKKKEACLPVWVSATVDESGCLWSGETVEQFWRAVTPYAPFCIGLNCSVGVDSIYTPLQFLSAASDRYTAAIPSAGLPDETGLYPDPPEKITNRLSQMAEEKIVNLIGGCCGTTPELIQKLATATTNLKPRQT